MEMLDVTNERAHHCSAIFLTIYIHTRTEPFIHTHAHACHVTLRTAGGVARGMRQMTQMTRAE